MGLPANCSYWTRQERRDCDEEDPLNEYYYGDRVKAQEMQDRHRSEDDRDPACGICYECLLGKYMSDPFGPDEKRSDFEKWFTSQVRMQSGNDMTAERIPRGSAYNLSAQMPGLDKQILAELDNLNYVIDQIPVLEQAREHADDLREMLRGLVKFGRILKDETLAEISARTKRYKDLLYPEREVFIRYHGDFMSNDAEKKANEVLGNKSEPVKSNHDPVAFAKYLIESNKTAYVDPGTLEMAEFVLKQSAHIEHLQNELKQTQATLKTAVSERDRLAGDLQIGPAGLYMRTIVHLDSAAKALEAARKELITNRKQDREKLDKLQAMANELGIQLGELTKAH